MRVAIMQPYFIPYAGYFRLMAACDLFVVYDCVQFPRRGWVHRNKLTHRSGTQEWLTLPLLRSERDSTRIMDLCFAEHAQTEWEERLAQFPVINQNKDHPLVKGIQKLDDNPCDFIERSLKEICATLGIHCQFARSSTLNLPPDLKSQDRILAIVRHFGASDYTNAPGGRGLYDEGVFAHSGIRLHFLPDYNGNYGSILERIVSESTDILRNEILANL